MYTETQIRAAGISGEISSIDVEHLINVLKRNKEPDSEICNNQESIMLSTLSHEQIAVMFLEWVQDEKYWRTAKKLGGGWFKIGNSGNYTTSQLFNVFLKEMDEELSALELSTYYSQLEEASRNFGGL